MELVTGIIVVLTRGEWRRGIMKVVRRCARTMLVIKVTTDTIVDAIITLTIIALSLILTPVLAMET
jgi:hypothetical protein